MFILFAAPVQEIYFVKENATTENQHIPYTSHLQDVSWTIGPVRSCTHCQ